MKIQESEKIDKYLELVRERKAVEQEKDGDTDSSWCVWNGTQEPRKGTGRVGNQWSNRDHSNLPESSEEF